MEEATLSTPHVDVDSLYEQLRPRRADIVGDLVGSELFLVQGDSLLLHCFSGGRIDFKGKRARSRTGPSNI